MSSHGLISGDPLDQLPYVVETMRAMSRETDPQKMVQAYGNRVRMLLAIDRSVSLSRRDLNRPRVRVTRSNLLAADTNPWENPDALPVLDGGLLSDLIWSDEPALINDVRLDPADPGAKYLAGMRSLVAIPLFDAGHSLNMIILARGVPDGFRPELLPEHVLMSNLFGRATNSLVLSQRLREAYADVDREMSSVGDIQRSLLPTALPDIPGLQIAAHYQASRRAGGDYYDFFPLPAGRWGVLVADVSGHGTPAAVIMAVTHSIAHSYPGEPESPGHLLRFVNDQLAARYTGGTGTFVTAFYGVYDPAARTVTYATAGHCPPRVCRAAVDPTTGHRTATCLSSLDQSHHLPLGIDPGEPYADQVATLRPGDAVLIYTDGIIEARDGAGDLFGTDRLDDVLRRHWSAPADRLCDAVLTAVDAFTHAAAAADDRTLLAIRVG